MQLDDSTVFGVLSTVGAAIAAAIGKLWHMMHKAQAKNLELLKSAESRMQDQLDKCEERHDEANGHVLDLTKQVSTLRGANELATTVTQALADSQQKMLTEMRKVWTDDST